MDHLGPPSAITVGAAGIHRSRVPPASWPDKLPQAVAEILHLACAQYTADPQKLGMGSSGSQVSLGTWVSGATILKKMNHSKGRVAPSLWLGSMMRLPAYRSE